MTTTKQIAEKRMPEVEVTASASFEDLLKLPDGQAVVVDVAKIRQALQTAERRGREALIDELYDIGKGSSKENADIYYPFKPMAQLERLHYELHKDDQSLLKPTSEEER